MKKIFLLAVLTSLFLISCKKTSIDASSTKSLQSSINDMASSLNTIQQYKFNEALYILKTFGVEGKDDFAKLRNLGKLIDGKKIPEILTLADQVAQKNSIEWSSTGPPSLGEMNIFSNTSAKESDSNDIIASSLSINVVPTAVDSISGPKSMQIIPKLVDNTEKPISFSGAALETTLEIYSGGNILLTSKNLMTDNNFKGFGIRFASLPKDKIIDGKIDVKVSVKTSQKIYQMTKAGVSVNEKELYTPPVPKETDTETVTTTETTPENSYKTEDGSLDPQKAKTDPKFTVSAFLNNLKAQNLKSAFNAADNPNWNSYDAFANPTSGFGSVKNLTVKSISTTTSNDKTALVNSTYDVTDKNGNIIPLKVTFGLKNVNGEWKISSYKINQ